MSNTTIQSPWTGTNLYLQILLLIASFWGGISPDTAGVVVAAGAGVVGAIGALRTWAVQAKLTTAQSWIGDKNNWSYLAAIVVGFVPVAAPIFEPLQSLAESLISGNWGAVITAGFALLSVVYYTFFKK